MQTINQLLEFFVKIWFIDFQLCQNIFGKIQRKRKSCDARRKPIPMQRPYLCVSYKG